MISSQSQRNQPQNVRTQRDTPEFASGYLQLNDRGLTNDFKNKLFYLPATRYIELMDLETDPKKKKESVVDMYFYITFENIPSPEEHLLQRIKEAKKLYPRNQKAIDEKLAETKEEREKYMEQLNSLVNEINESMQASRQSKSTFDFKLIIDKSEEIHKKLFPEGFETDDTKKEKAIKLLKEFDQEIRGSNARTS